MFQHYGLMESKQLALIITTRSHTAIQNRAKVLGLVVEKPRLKDTATDEDMQEEKNLIIGELEHFLPVACAGDPLKVRQALDLFRHMQRNSAAWWWKKRHMKLGAWSEMFVKGYTYDPKPLIRDEFLDETGSFMARVEPEVYSTGLTASAWHP
jgi:hypothetical protein